MKLDSKIYIAGHQGLVGSAIIRKLEEEGYTNIVTRTFQDLDLRSQQEVNDFFAQEQLEYVFLAAAKVGGILANDTYKAEFIYDNLMIACNVIHAAYKFGVKKLLNLGSSCIYPRLAPQPMREEYLLTGSLEQTNEPYAVAKIAAIKLCRYYNEQYGTDFVSVMPTNLYGTNDNFNLETAHVLPALIRKFHLAKLLVENKIELIKQDLIKVPVGFGMQGNEISSYSDQQVIAILKDLGLTKDSVTLWGTGAPYREFLYVDDLARAVYFVMKNKNSIDVGELINIGTGVDIQIQDLAQLVKGIVGFSGDINWNTQKPNGTPRKLLDISRLKRLGWRSAIDITYGIKLAYQYYLEKNKMMKSEKGIRGEVHVSI